VPSLQALPQAPDLAVVVTPARTVPALVADAGARGVPNLLVLSAGFAEVGPDGQKLQDEMLSAARQHGIRLIGPNSLGSCAPRSGLNATFARTSARPGSVALVSQSGAVVAALLDTAWAAGFGFSSVVTTGDGSDVQFAELLDFLAMDPETRSIALYVEACSDRAGSCPRFERPASMKPVVVLKAGRHTIGSNAALSHTGALAGNDRAWDTALRRCGAIRIREYDQLLVASETLAGGRMPQGSRLAILTNGGGPGVLAADAVADQGAVLAELSDAGALRSTRCCPRPGRMPTRSTSVGRRGSVAFGARLRNRCVGPRQRRCAGRVLSDGAGRRSGRGAGLAWSDRRHPQAGRSGVARRRGCRRGTRGVQGGGHRIAGQSRAWGGKRSRSWPSTCATASSDCSCRPRSIRRRPVPRALDIGRSRQIVDAVRSSGRNVLNEDEAKAMLAACGIEVAQGRLATSAAQARELAEQIGFPRRVEGARRRRHAQERSGRRAAVAEERRRGRARLAS